MKASVAINAASAVEDPELPMVTIGDLGMVRGARIDEDGTAVIDVAPTYSGCPATEVIHRSVEAAVRAAGFPQVEVRMIRTPPWTTDWITERGRELLEAHGIAPPGPASTPKGLALFREPPRIQCPRCGSASTEQVSLHGSTPCKSMYRCKTCLEPFEHFKCH